VVKNKAWHFQWFLLTTPVRKAQIISEIADCCLPVGVVNTRLVETVGDERPAAVEVLVCSRRCRGRM